MNFQDEFRSWSLALLKDPLFLQITPLAIFVLFPLIVLLFVQTVFSLGSSSPVTWRLAMVFESFTFSLPWNWSSSSGTQQETKKLKKKVLRTRSEQIELNGHARPRMYLFSCDNLIVATHQFQSTKTMLMMAITPVLSIYPEHTVS